jgi:hypothetical protein
MFVHQESSHVNVVMFAFQRLPQFQRVPQIQEEVNFLLEGSCYGNVVTFAFQHQHEQGVTATNLETKPWPRCKQLETKLKELLPKTVALFVLVAIEPVSGFASMLALIPCASCGMVDGQSEKGKQLEYSQLVDVRLREIEVHSPLNPVFYLQMREKMGAL